MWTDKWLKHLTILSGYMYMYEYAEQPQVCSDDVDPWGQISYTVYVCG